jgi:uncharacterized protein (DUF58 family)
VTTPPTLAPPAARQGPGRIPSALVEALDLLVSRRVARGLPGDRRAAGVGTGTELAQLRPYQYGDDVRHIDAAATARTREPHVRLHVPERTLTTWIVHDVSPSMAFGTGARLKADVAEGVVLVVARLAARRGGRVALMTAGAATQRFLPPRSGRGALPPVHRVLTEGVARDGHHDPEALERTLRRVAQLATHAGLIVVVSDFRGPRTWRRALAALRARHSVLAVEVRDPREGELPAVGHLALIDPETGERLEVDTHSSKLRERFAAAEAEERGNVAADLRRALSEHIVLTTEGDWLRALGGRLR